MRVKGTTRVWWQGIIYAGLFMAALILWQQWLTRDASAAELAAAAQVEQAWQNVRSSTQYAFSADIQIKTIPLPTAGNIGRFSQTDSLYVEGTNNLAQNTIQMALWGGSVSVADRANAYQVRTQHGRTETRIGDGDWQTSITTGAARLKRENKLPMVPGL